MSGIGEDAMRLWTGVIGPLVLGGRLAPIRPIGPAKAIQLAEHGPGVVAASDRTWIDAVRVRRARLLSRVDTVDVPDRAQWLMAAALNDLLQSTNPRLDGVLSKNSGKLLAACKETLDGVEPPRDVRQLLSRHATFARLLELERVDTMLTWWTGSAAFRGCAPPARLLAWKRLRRVQSTTERAPLTEMTEGSQLDEGQFLEAVGRLISLSPLTDLATASRKAPAFAWSAAAIGVIITLPGHALAMRALRSKEPNAALAALRRAHARLAGTPFEPAVQSVVDELAAHTAVA